MALTRAKYKRVPDLYVAGTEVVLKDGQVMWMQVLNPFEAEEARHDAQVARSRLVMALKEHGSDEMNFIKAALLQDGLDGARERVVASKSSNRILKIVEGLKNDPEWTERLEILDRTDQADRPLEEAEQRLLSDLQHQYVTEVSKRMADEEEYLRQQYANADEATLITEYEKLYLERRGADLATAEYRIVEIWYGARVCEGVQDAAGDWNHDACEGHQLRVFETKAEVRSLPEDLGDLLGEVYNNLSMSIRDAKDLDRLASSSVSSRQPSAEAVSTPSTPAETPSAALGTSPQPSLTP